jgi:hypothetical protein
MKQIMMNIACLAAFLMSGSIGLCAEPFAKGPYLGQTPPGPTAQVFAPGLISDTRPHTWEAWGTFSADGNTFCFCGGHIKITENTDQGWTVPKRIKSIPDMSTCCYLSPDANSIYVNCRYDPAKPYSLYRCMRTSQGWSMPQELGPPFSVWGQGAGFSVAANNSIYFNSNKIPDGQCRFMVAPFVDNTWAQPIKIPVEQGNLWCCHAGIAPDESFIVFYSIGPGAQGGTPTDLYLTLRGADGTWTKPRNMGPRINSRRYYEWGASISPDKQYLFFTRSNGWSGNSNSNSADIYWVALKEYLPESHR